MREFPDLLSERKEGREESLQRVLECKDLESLIINIETDGGQVEHHEIALTDVLFLTSSCEIRQQST